MPLEIRPVDSKKELERFLHVPWTLGMKSDPNWVPPLLDDYRRSLDPKKSPFLKHGEIQCFIACDGGQPVGRISAQIDTDFDKQWPQEKGVAFFGFFDSKDDPAVARPVRRGLRLGALQGEDADPRALHAGFQGRGRHPRRRLRHAAAHRHAAQPPLPRPADRVRRAHQGEGLLCLVVHLRAHRRAHASGSRNGRCAAERARRPIDLSQFAARSTSYREHLQLGVVAHWNFTPFTSAELEIMATEYKMFVDTEIALVAEAGMEAAATRRHPQCGTRW